MLWSQGYTAAVATATALVQFRNITCLFWWAIWHCSLTHQIFIEYFWGVIVTIWLPWLFCIFFTHNETWCIGVIPKAEVVKVIFKVLFLFIKDDFRIRNISCDITNINETDTEYQNSEQQLVINIMVFYVEFEPTTLSAIDSDVATALTTTPCGQ